MGSIGRCGFVGVGFGESSVCFKVKYMLTVNTLYILMCLSALLVLDVVRHLLS